MLEEFRPSGPADWAGRSAHLRAAPCEAVARTEHLQRLWERRLKEVRQFDEANAGEELGGFAWWFASGNFPADWSLAQLQPSLEAGARLHSDHVVAARLAALRDDHLAKVVRCLELLVESGTRLYPGSRVHYQYACSEAAPGIARARRQRFCRRSCSSPPWTRTNNPPVNSRMLCQ